MRFFTGQYDRTIDDKNRIQLPSQLRSAIDPERDGPGLYVTLGEDRGTLSIYTERGFEEAFSRGFEFKQRVSVAGTQRRLYLMKSRTL